MRIDVFTIFPGIFESPLRESLLGKALAAKLIDVRLHDIRGFADDRHRTVDDESFGGGPGMVMKPDPIFAAVEAVRTDDAHVVLLSPRGRLFRQSIADELSRRPHLVLICGHYEGVDERVSLQLVDDELSIGDYVLTGGELPAMVVVDAVARLLPGVLGAKESALDESHCTGLLEYPHYTRPAEFRGWRVPEILLSGHHGEIERWRRAQALERTRRQRPELLSSREPGERSAE